MVSDSQQMERDSKALTPPPSVGIGNLPGLRCCFPTKLRNNKKQSKELLEEKLPYLEWTGDVVKF